MRMLSTIAVLLAATPATAQTAPPAAAACPTTPAPLPAAWAGWDRPTAVESGGVLRIGTAGIVTLVPAPAFVVAPEKTPKAGHVGAVLRFTVATAGTYQIGLGGPLWVDVVRAGQRLPTTAHGHGPACSPIRKMVDFALSPGDYVVQLSGASEATSTARATVMIARRCYGACRDATNSHRAG